MTRGGDCGCVLGLGGCIVSRLGTGAGVVGAGVAGVGVAGAGV